MPAVLMISRNLSSATGSLAIVAELARGFRQRAWRVDLCGERPSAEIVLSLGVRAQRIRPLPLVRGYAGRRLFAWRSARRARGGRYDLVVGHGDSLTQDVLLLHNLIHRGNEMIPGGEPRKLASVGRLHAEILRPQRFRLCIANSDLMRTDLMARFGLSEEKLRVLHPGYDPVRFHPLRNTAERDATRRRLRVDEGTVLIGLVTSGDFRKRGLGLLLEAFAQLDPTRRRRARLLVVGRDHTRPYREQASTLGIGASVSFHPPSAAIAELYRALDILVHPAYIEEFGLVVQEAMACGVPVITSRHVGAAELLSDNEMVLPAPSVAGLAERLSLLIADPAARRSWSQRAIDAVAANTWDRYRAGFFRLLQQFDLLPRS